jgi:hypothetical protein
MSVIISRSKTIRLVAVLMLSLLVAVPITSAYLNPAIDMTDYAKEKSCYCHGPLPVSEVDVLIDVPLQVPFTPENASVDVSIGVLGDPQNLTGFGLFLNASDDSTGVEWTKRFSNSTVDVNNGVTAGIIEINETDRTTMWTVDKVEDPWFNVSFIPGRTDQSIVLSVTGMRADDSGDETGDFWNVAMVTIEVREQRLVNLTVGVTNQESIAVSGALVDFYIDNEYIGNSSTSEIPPAGSQNATFAWDATFAKEGKHKMRAVIDPEGHITETDKSNNEVTRDIWLGGPPEETDLTIYYGLGSMAVGVVIIVAVFYFWRRRQYRF